MNNIKKISSYIFISLLIWSCGEPAPTELLSDENSVTSNVQIETISNDVDASINSYGYDSTGIINPFLKKSTIINITGVRNSSMGTIQNEGYYYAIFNDKDKPVMVKGKKLIGFKSKNFNSVRFNNYEAIPIPNKISYMDRMMVRDTVLGIKYFANQRMMRHNGQMHNFPFLSKVNFKAFVNKNSFVQFDIETPDEIIGKITFEGSRARKNLYLTLEWNALPNDNVEIVIARIKQNETEPLIKIRHNNNGKIKIPFSVIEQLVALQDKKIIISFIRKIEKELNFNLLDDTFITAQSIHNIKIDIP